MALFFQRELTLRSNLLTTWIEFAQAVKRKVITPGGVLLIAEFLVNAFIQHPATKIYRFDQGCPSFFVLYQSIFRILQTSARTLVKKTQGI